MARPHPSPQGMTVRDGDLTLILYDETLPSHRRNFTIAHEIGHLVLGHTTPSPEAEREADAFAAAFLAPNVLIGAWEEVHGERMSPRQIEMNFSVCALTAKRKRLEMDGQDRGVFSERLARRLFEKTE